jgi:hypothetical protein
MLELVAPADTPRESWPWAGAVQKRAAAAVASIVIALRLTLYSFRSFRRFWRVLTLHPLEHRPAGAAIVLAHRQRAPERGELFGLEAAAERTFHGVGHGGAVKRRPE